MSARPTDRQLSVLRAIHELTWERGLSPTMRAVAGWVGCSVEVVWEEVHALRARGYLVPAAKGAPRSLRLTDEGLREIGMQPMVEVPRGVLEEALYALDLQPKAGPAGWWTADAAARAAAKRRLRMALGDDPESEAQELRGN